MSITFKQTIIHNLDLSYGVPLLSKELLVLNDETESFITRKIIQTIEDQGACEAKFKEQLSLFPEDNPISILKNWTSDSLKHFSEILADRFYRYMAEYGNIPNGDLIVTNYLMDSDEYVAIMKINFCEKGYTHSFDHEDDSMKLAVNKCIYEKKTNEAVIIKLSDISVTLLDGSKGKYMSMLFDLVPSLSVKEKLKAIDTVATKVIEEHYENPVKAMAELKNNISESIARTQTIPIQEIMEETFGEDEEALESCMGHLMEFGLHEEKPIEVTSSKVTNKYATQKLKTDTGVEVKMPTHLFNDPDFIEIINEANGTQTLLIKNVSQIVNK